MFSCEKCGRTFKRNDTLKRHLEKRKTSCVEGPKQHICGKCGTLLSCSSSLWRHKTTCRPIAEPGKYDCEVCNAELSNVDSLRRHKKTCKGVRDLLKKLDFDGTQIPGLAHDLWEVFQKHLGKIQVWERNLDGWNRIHKGIIRLRKDL